MKPWDFEPETKEAKQLLATLEKYLVKHYGKRCKRMAYQCAGCKIWAIYDILKLEL